MRQTATKWILLAVISALAVAAQARNFTWSTPLIMWGDALSKAQDKARPHQNYGAALFNDWLKSGHIPEGDVLSQIRGTYEALTPGGKKIWDEAKAHFIRALEIEPRYATAALALGKQYLQELDFDRALTFLLPVAENGGQARAEAYYSLSIVLLAQKKYEMLCRALGKSYSLGNKHAWYGYQKCLYHDMGGDLSGSQWAVWRWKPN